MSANRDDSNGVTGWVTLDHKKCKHVFITVREEVGGGRCAYDEPRMRSVTQCKKCGAYLVEKDKC